MINLLGICLVISSLVSAGLWSPNPQKHNTKVDDVIIKDGHRVVVVEYDQQGQHNTKVSISPEHDNYHKPPSLEENISEALDDTKDKIKEAASVLPNLGQGLSRDHYYQPGELICDAYGICKHKVTGAIVKAKDKAHGAAHEAKDMFSHEARDIKEGAKESMAKVTQTAAETAKDVREGVKESLSKAKETAKEGAKESLSKAKEAAKEAKDLGKTIGEGVTHHVSKQVGRVRDSLVEKAKEGSQKAKEGSEKAAKKAKRSLKQGFDKVGRIFIGVMMHLGFSDAMDALMGVLNLMGFAMAYGMCVWVTFISSYVLAGALPRQQFGIVQSKIYPAYFRALATSIGLSFLGHTPRLFGTRADVLQGANLLGSVLMVFANSFYLEPQATKVMFERIKVEKEEGRGSEGTVPESSRATQTTTTGETDVDTTTTTTRVTRPQESPEQEVVRSKLIRLSERLKELNTYSSMLNILTLMSLSWHLVYLAQRLLMVC